MAERLETGVSVACALSAHADATEGDFDIGDVHERVVVDEVAGENVVVEPACVFAIVAEDVARERRRVVFDDFARFAFGIVRVQGQNGENGAEDLLFHEGMVGISQFDDGRFDAEFFRSRIAARHNGFAVAEHGRNAVEMTLVDDVSHARFVGEHAGDGGFDGFAEGIDEVVRDEDVIGGDAGLARVREFGEGDAVGDGCHILDIKNDGRRFSSQFKNIRDQRLGGGFGDVFGGACASGEEDEIDRFSQELLGGFGAAFDDDDAFGIQICR